MVLRIRVGRPGPTPLLLLLAGLQLLGPWVPPLRAQDKTHWALPTTIGYGGIACAMGYLAGVEVDRGAATEGVNFFPASLSIGACLGGLRIGLAVGRKADNLLAEGEALGRGHRRGVQLGTVLAGSTLGGLLSFIHVSVQEGRDAEIHATYALGGAGAGLLAQILLNDHLDPRGPPPVLELGAGPEGGVSFGFAFRF